ncbi:MAG TPA: hypothetical protein VF680_16225 [Allosphingosinicella sp.]
MTKTRSAIVGFPALPGLKVSKRRPDGVATTARAETGGMKERGGGGAGTAAAAKSMASNDINEIPV